MYTIKHDYMKKEENNKAQNRYIVADGTPFSRDNEYFKLIMKEIKYHKITRKTNKKP